ncbi:TasA family protein [Neobacillus sp. SCS-31]|uniref:TasA family protein n=1 Tax=Neobacillus oceani TaxID=3115292 RepID=UPI003905B574
MVKSKASIALIAVSSTILTAGIIGGSTFALFTSSASNTNNTVTAGTLDISLDKEDPTGGAYFNVMNMAPGDSEIKPVVVSNEGSLPLDYTMSLSIEGDLGTIDSNSLKITAYLSEADAQANSNSINLDEFRHLDAKGGAKEKETIYVKVQLPLAAGNIYQNKNGTASIVVNAQQIIKDDFSTLIWQKSGVGTTTITPSTDKGVSFIYNTGNQQIFNGEWKYSTIAEETKNVSFNWNYSGLHGWFRASAKVTFFVDGPNGTTYKDLFNSSVYDGFNLNGQEIIKVNKGYNYGVIISGSHFDSSYHLFGTFKMTPNN